MEPAERVWLEEKGPPEVVGQGERVQTAKRARPKKVEPEEGAWRGEDGLAEGVRPEVDFVQGP